jgi:hypothetical protein
VLIVRYYLERDVIAFVVICGRGVQNNEKINVVSI